MDFVTILRFIHIVSAIFWVGTTLFMLFFLEPVMKRTGQAGSQVMHTLIATTRFPQVIALSGIVTVLVGLVLYWHIYGFDIATMFDYKLPLTLGALAGILATFTGSYFQGRSGKALVTLGAAVAGQSSPPTPEQIAQMQHHQNRIVLGTRVSAVLMVLAVIGMVM